MQKSAWIVLSAALVLSLGAAQRTATPAKAQDITVWRTATCGCCGKWVDHLKAAGFNPTVHIVQTTDEAPPSKDLPRSLRSCHGATLEGYNVEGHVPVSVIEKLLRERPKIAGITVPGMPAGSPGMESPYPVAYDVIAYDAKGNTSVFARITPPKQ